MLRRLRFRLLDIVVRATMLTPGELLCARWADVRRTEMPWMATELRKSPSRMTTERFGFAMRLARIIKPAESAATTNGFHERPRSGAGTATRPVVLFVLGPQ